MTATEPGAAAAGGVDIKAWFGTELGKVSGALGGRLDSIEKRLDTPPPQPVFATPTASGIVDANGAAILDLGAPPQGTFWIVHRIIVGGVTRATAFAGTADVYVARSRSEVAAATLTALRDSTNLTTLPGVAFYGDEQVTCQAEERLWIAIVGGTATQNAVAAAGVTQWREGNTAQGWSL